jgi:hypothetical protein
MPYLNRRAPSRKHEELNPLIKLKLLDGEWWEEIYTEFRRVSDD